MNNNNMDEDDNHNQPSAPAKKNRVPSWITSGVRKKKKKRLTQRSTWELTKNQTNIRPAVEAQGENRPSKCQSTLEEQTGGGERITTYNESVGKPLSSIGALQKVEKQVVFLATGNSGLRPGTTTKVPVYPRTFKDTTPIPGLRSTKQQLDPPSFEAQQKNSSMNSIKIAHLSLPSKAFHEGNAEDTWPDNDDLFSNSDLEGDSLLLQGAVSPAKKQTGSPEKTKLTQNSTKPKQHKKPKIPDSPSLTESPPPKHSAGVKFSVHASKRTLERKEKSTLRGDKGLIPLIHQQGRDSPAPRETREDPSCKKLQGEEKKAMGGCSSRPIDLTEDLLPSLPTAVSESSSMKAMEVVKLDSRGIVHGSQVDTQWQSEEEKEEKVKERQHQQQQQQQQQIVKPESRAIVRATQVDSHCQREEEKEAKVEERQQQHQPDKDTMVVIIAGLKQPCFEQQLKYTAKLRRYLCHTQGKLSLSDLDLICQEGLLSRLIYLLKKHDKSDLQNEAVWALTCFVGKQHEETEISTPAIEAIISLLSDNSSDDAFSLAVWSLDNIAQISTACRDLILTEGGMHALVASMKNKRDFEVLKLLLRLCRGTPAPPLSLVEPAFELLAKIIINARSTDEVLKEACRSLFYLLNCVDDDRVEIVRGLGIIEGVVAIMLDSTPSTQKWALTVIKLLSRGDILMKQSIMKAKPCFNKILWLSSDTDILHDTCRTIGFIASGNKDLIQLLIDAEVFPDLIKFLSHDSLRVRKSAFLAVSAATHAADARQIDFLVQKGALRLLCRTWLASTEKSSVVIALQAVLNILQKLERHRLGAFVTVGGKERVQGLADSNTSNTEIRLAARQVLACVAEIQDTL